MAKIACSSMEAAMEQDDDSEGVEALQHGLHQILLFLVFLQATTLHGALLFHADNTCRLVPNHAPRMFRRLASSPFASLFCRGTKRPLAAPSAALEAAMKVAPREDLSLRSTIVPVLISYANLKTSAPLCYHFRPYDVRCAAWSEAGHFVAFAVQEPDSTAEGMIERLPLPSRPLGAVSGKAAKKMAARQMRLDRWGSSVVLIVAVLAAAGPPPLLLRRWHRRRRADLARSRSPTPCAPPTTPASGGARILHSGTRICGVHCMHESLC